MKHLCVHPKRACKLVLPQVEISLSHLAFAPAAVCTYALLTWLLTWLLVIYGCLHITIYDCCGFTRSLRLGSQHAVVSSRS